MRCVKGIGEPLPELRDEELPKVFKDTEGLEVVVLIKVLKEVLLETRLERRALHQENEVVLSKGFKGFIWSIFLGWVFDNLIGNLEFLFNGAEEVIVNVEVGGGFPESSLVKIQAIFD